MGQTLLPRSNFPSTSASLKTRLINPVNMAVSESLFLSSPPLPFLQSSPFPFFTIFFFSKINSTKAHSFYEVSITLTIKPISTVIGEKTNSRLNIGENFLNKLLSNQIQKYIKKIIYLQTKCKSTTKRSSTLHSKIIIIIIIIELTEGPDGKQDGADSSLRGKSVVTTMVLLETNQVNNTINVQKVKFCLYVSSHSFRTSGMQGMFLKWGNVVASHRQR